MLNRYPFVKTYKKTLKNTLEQVICLKCFTFCYATGAAVTGTEIRVTDISYPQHNIVCN